MAEETVTQQIVREAPEIEAYKLKLLQEAQKLAFNQGGGQTLAQQLPSYQVAGFDRAQQIFQRFGIGKTGIMGWSRTERVCDNFE